jgi:2-oxoglutarate dehydrogenase E2 component (dihydrolipoamide succinyltransferase)
MAIELKVPPVGESITEVEIGDWLKGKGESVTKDDPVVTLESEKATIELPAPESGTLTTILKEKGQVAAIGEVIGLMDAQGSPAAAGKTAEKKRPETPRKEAAAEPTAEVKVMPAARRALEEHGLSVDQVKPTGPGGRLLKEDVLRQVAQPQAEPPAPEVTPPSTQAKPETAPPAKDTPPQSSASAPGSPAAREEEVVPMSRLRRTVAERLVQAQHTAALLTTFNEVDMSGIAALRKEYGEMFQQRYQVKLGFMSFFVKACVDALKLFPALNAEVRGTDIVYHNYFDIGVAVGSGKGLVVPVLRNAEHLSFAEIETTIGDLARRARENKLKLEELHGGTFTISNGGVYGSMLSTPIVNPPQSGVLGMHAIQDRPVARDGAVVVRPMMYLALTYDHRLVDGREAVSFLKRIKDVIENPTRMLMEI